MLVNFKMYTIITSSYRQQLFKKKKYIYIYIYIHTHTHKGVLLLSAQNDKLLKPVKSWFLREDSGFAPDVLHGEKFTLFLLHVSSLEETNVQGKHTE